MYPDGQGVRFNLSVPSEMFDYPPHYGRNHGDLFYCSIPAPDPEASKRFCSSVFGWTYDEAGDGGGIHVSNVVTECGLGGGRLGTAPEAFFRVDDLTEAGRKVAELGGTVLTEVMEGDEGSHLMCLDDQGVGFGLSQAAAGC